MSNAFQRTYWSNDVAELLSISTSALRKWSLRLEAEGYIFIRDEHDRRAYRDSDLVVLRKMKEFLNNKMSMESAAKSICVLYNDNQHKDKRTSIVLSKKEGFNQYQILEAKFDQYIEKQMIVNQTLLEEIKQKDQYIEATLKSIDERLKERDERLIETMNIVLETKKLIAASVSKAQSKKKWFNFFMGDRK